MLIIDDWYCPAGCDLDGMLNSFPPKCPSCYSTLEQTLLFRLRKRAEIRRQIKTRKSVQEGKADKIADLLDEAANEIERLRGS